MPDSAGSGDRIEVGTKRNAVAVSIPEGATLELPDAKAINREFMEIARRDDVTGALTILKDDAELTESAFKELERAAAADVSLDIDRWAIVGDDSTETTAFSSHVVGIQTKRFDTTNTALNWLAGED